MEQYEVLRKISGSSAQIGEVVDCAGWPNARMLERQRYLRRVWNVQQPRTEKPAQQQGRR